MMREPFKLETTEISPVRRVFYARGGAANIIGRVTESKGVFDRLEMAQSLERTDPGLLHWTICGKGDGFDELKARREAMGLKDVVVLAGCEAPFHDRGQSLTAGLWKLLDGGGLLGRTGQPLRLMPVPGPAAVEVSRATREAARIS